jgi:hypothetical protein
VDEARRYVAGVTAKIASSALGRASAKSALQQTAICGLEEPGFPDPADACQGPRAVARSLPARWQEDAEADGVMPVADLRRSEFCAHRRRP